MGVDRVRTLTLVRLGLQILYRQRVIEASMGSTLSLQLLLPPGCVVLVHLVFYLTHALCFFDTKHLPLLVPAPLVDLALSQARALAHKLKRLL